MYLCTCKTTLDLHEFGFTRGRTKTGWGVGGRRGCSRRGTFVHALFCSTALVTFVSKYSDFFLRMTQHVIYSQVYACNHERKHVAGGGGGGGGRQLLPEGCHGGVGGGGGGGSWPPPPKLCLIRGCMVPT